MIRPRFQPPADRPVVAAIASGRFERNTAAITATLTPVPSSKPSPITADSGMPSRTIPSTIARADPAPAVRRIFLRPSPPIRSTSRSPTKNVTAPAESPSATLPLPAEVSNASATSS